MSDEYMLSGKMNQPSSRFQNAFLSAQNEDNMLRTAYLDLQRQYGSDLTDKQKQRLVKTVRHYMNKVQEDIPEESIKTKISETLNFTKKDFMSYVSRSQAAPPAREEDASRMDIATRFSQLQNERNTAKSTPPAPPNFRLTLEDDGPSAMSIFETAKKQREEEALKGQQLIQQNMRAESNFKESQQQSTQFEQSILADRERMRQAIQKTAASEMANRLVPPDPRRMFMKESLEASLGNQGTPLEAILTQSGLATANPTIALPESLRMKPSLPQDNIIRQDDILAYKENEYNLFVYSADRDWVLNKSQNRYNFTVNFDPANNGPGQTFAPTATVKFKNITRIELVKTILPIEGIDILQTVTNATGPVYGTSLNVNILSFPYLNVYIPELDTNGFGTDTFLNQAFASLQYDANWVSDTSMVSKGGYLAMIPKFLKCQKVYTPTPLSTLRKMTISIQRPDGCLVSDTQDTQDIANIVSSYWLGATSGWTLTGTDYDDTTGTYIWINTGNWFSRFEVNQGDRIQMKNIAFPAAYTGNEAAKNDLITFLTRPEGHLVVQIAYQSSATAVTDGANSVGYANYIIIRSKMTDPTKGSTAVDTFGKLGSVANNTFLNTLTSTDGATGRLINLNHQTTLVFRVITRDLDSTTRLRPDNM